MVDSDWFKFRKMRISMLSYFIFYLKKNKFIVDDNNILWMKIYSRR